MCVYLEIWLYQRVLSKSILDSRNMLGKQLVAVANSSSSNLVQKIKRLLYEYLEVLMIQAGL